MAIFAFVIADHDAFGALRSLCRNLITSVAAILEFRRNQEVSHDREHLSRSKSSETRRELLLIEHDLQAILTRSPISSSGPATTTAWSWSLPASTRSSAMRRKPSGTGFCDHYRDPQQSLRDRDGCCRPMAMSSWSRRSHAPQGGLRGVGFHQRRRPGSTPKVSFTGIDGISRDDIAKRTEQDLLAAKDQAEQANNLKTQFLAK